MHSSVEVHLSCFRLLGSVNRASVDICGASICGVGCQVFRAYATSVIAGHCGRFLFSFLRLSVPIISRVATLVSINEWFPFQHPYHHVLSIV